MKQIPSTLAISVLLIIGAEWPSVQQWSDTQVLHHYLVHGLFLLAGGLIGLQSAIWMDQPQSLSTVDEETGVVS